MSPALSSPDVSVCICLLPVCLSASLSIRLPVCLPVCLPACLPACLSVCMSVCLSVCLSVSLSVWGEEFLQCVARMCLSVHPSTHLSACLLGCPSRWQCCAACRLKITERSMRSYACTSDNTWLRTHLRSLCFRVTLQSLLRMCCFKHNVTDVILVTVFGDAGM